MHSGPNFATLNGMRIGIGLRMGANLLVVGPRSVRIEVNVPRVSHHLPVGRQFRHIAIGAERIRLVRVEWRLHGVHGHLGGGTGIDFARSRVAQIGNRTAGGRLYI